MKDLHIEAFYPANAETEALLSAPPWV